MKIGVNGIGLKPKNNAGMDNYTIQLLNELAKICDDAIYLFIISEEYRAKDLNPEIKQICIYNYNKKIIGYRSIAEQIIMLKYLNKYNIDVLLCPFYTAPILSKVPVVVTVHDMIYKIKNDGGKKLWHLYRSILNNLSILRADKIITVSNYSKKDILNYFPKLNNIHVTHLGVINYKRKDIKKPKFIKSTDEFILMVGSISPRKNIIRAVKALENIKNITNLKLVLAGELGYSSKNIIDYIKKSPISERIIITGYISDEDLAWCYEKSKALLFCSLHEGFGLPPLESMISETPVIASNTTSIPEVVGNAALLVNPYSVPEISSAISELQKNTKLRKELINKGSNRYKLFSWKKTAEETLEIIKKAVNQ